MFQFLLQFVNIHTELGNIFACWIFKLVITLQNLVAPGPYSLGMKLLPFLFLFWCLVTHIFCLLFSLFMWSHLFGPCSFFLVPSSILIVSFLQISRFLLLFFFLFCFFLLPLCLHVPPWYVFIYATPFLFFNFRLLYCSQNIVFYKQYFF